MQRRLESFVQMQEVLKVCFYVFRIYMIAKPLQINRVNLKPLRLKMQKQPTANIPATTND